MNEFVVGVAVASALHGFRHGFDIDHLSALSDITASTSERKRAFRLASLYVAGHAAVVLVLGVLAITLGAHLPEQLDAAMSRVIGATLVVLGGYLLYRVVRDRGRVRLRSRWVLMADGLRSATRRLQRPNEIVVIEHSHDHTHDGLHAHGHTAQRPRSSVAVAAHTHVHRHVATMPADPLVAYGTRVTFVIGVLHGIGAETPTQVLLFASAARAGMVEGIAILVAFVGGLVVANCAVALASAAGIATSRRWPLVRATVVVIVALFSVGIGLAYLAGAPDPATLFVPR